MVVYEANLLYSRNPPAACVFAAFSGRGIRRFQGRPESLAEYPVSHASSLYYPYRNPYSYRNGRKTSEAFVTGLEPYIRHFTVRSLCPASGPSVRLSHGAKITSDLYGCGRISKREAEYLLTFTNHASPVFIYTYLIHICLNDRFHPWLIYGPLLLSSCPHYGYLPFFCLQKSNKNS